MAQAGQVIRTIAIYLLQHPEIAPFLQEAGYRVTYRRTPPGSPQAQSEADLRQNAARIAAVLRRSPAVLTVLARAGIQIEPVAAPGATPAHAQGQAAAEGGAPAASPDAALPVAPEAETRTGPEAQKGAPALSLDAAERAWTALVAVLSRQAPQVAPHLQGTRPIALEDGQVVVGMPVNPTARMVLVSDKVSTFVQQFLARALGVPQAKVRYVYVDSGEILPEGEDLLVSELLTTVVGRLS